MTVSPSRPPARPQRSAVAVGVLCLWGVVLVVGTAGGLYRWQTAYRRFAVKALNDNIRYIEVAPGVRLTRPGDIAAVRTWLVQARRSPPAGATVYPADGEMGIMFGDGQTRRVRFGSPPLSEPLPRPAPAMSEVRWDSYTRYADAAEIGRLLSGPPSPAESGK